MKSIFLFTFFFPLFNELFAQEIDYSFNLTQYNKEILINISINKGSICSGIDIYRSTDTLIGFDKIGNIFGVCGSADFSQDFRFTDINPVPNSINYYKIIFGARQESKIQSLYYASYNDNGYSIFNEENQTSLFINTHSTYNKLKFYLYDTSGKLLHHIEEIIENKVTFSNETLHHGFYFFVLTEMNEKKVIQGKVFIP